jgi:hypothetical protein
MTSKFCSRSILVLPNMTVKLCAHDTPEKPRLLWDTSILKNTIKITKCNVEFTRYTQDNLSYTSKHFSKMCQQLVTKKGVFLNGHRSSISDLHIKR